MTPRERAEKLANYLFTSGYGDKAHRLMLVDENKRDLGGWSYWPVVDMIEDAIKDALANK